MLYEIKVGSVTNAQRGIKALKAKGYRPIMTRLENPSSKDGCGYIIKVYADSESVVSILTQKGITVLGVDRS